jgi:hypothetical protein
MTDASTANAEVDVTGAVASDTGPFAIVPHWLLERLVGMERTQSLALFVALTMWENKTTHIAWPSHATLAEMLGVGVTTIKRWLADLVEAEAVRSERRFTTNGDADSNRYVLLRCRPVARPSSTVGLSPSSESGLSGGAKNGLRTKSHLELEPLELESSRVARKAHSATDRPKSRSLKSEQEAEHIAVAKQLVSPWWERYKREHGGIEPTHDFMANVKTVARRLSKGWTPERLAPAIMCIRRDRINDWELGDILDGRIGPHGRNRSRNTLEEILDA